ncbi:TetR/AcrR family transcriptional regulator [Olivibacter sitiensis]|uniref:TetR/AcrR family transcriptional regulator n=1 Tax=Olivibacter sitiensis TaxID=376470 RepID=UPI000406EABD|nr:TetR/AcrR family transcriptional regulator [Olivibacter sitiensis]
MNVQLKNISDKKSILFTTFLKLANQHGIHGVSMSLLSSEAGVAAGTIYHHFESKDDFILALFKQVKQQMHNEIFRMKDDLTDDYPKAFQRIWMDLCKYYLEHPEVLNFIDQFFSSPYQKLIKNNDTQFCQNDFVSFFNRGVEQGLIKDYRMDILTSTFVGSIVITAKRHIMGDRPVNETDLKDMASIVWDGLKLELDPIEQQTGL